MKNSHTRARRVRMEPILENLDALILEIGRVKRPSCFAIVCRGALVAARDNATWELNRTRRRPEVAP